LALYPKTARVTPKPSYLSLLQVGFALPHLLLSVRCALTAPFHPYLSDRRYFFCCTFRRITAPSR